MWDASTLGATPLLRSAGRYVERLLNGGAVVIGLPELLVILLVIAVIYFAVRAVSRRK